MCGGGGQLEITKYPHGGSVVWIRQKGAGDGLERIIIVTHLIKNETTVIGSGEVALE